MLVEKWDGAHNFPRFNHDDGKPPGPKRMTTTLRRLRAFRGQFTFEDHETPWSVVCRNLDISIGNLPNYHGTATFNGGTVAIQDFVPMWANMKAQFVIDGSRIHLDRIDMETDGATTVATRRRRHGALAESGLPGEVARELSAHARALLQGRGVAPRRRRRLHRHVPAVQDRRGHQPRSDRHLRQRAGGPERLPVSGASTARCAGPSTASTSGMPARSSTAATRSSSTASSRSAQKTKPTHHFDATLTGVDLARFTDFEQFPGPALRRQRVAAQRARLAVGPLLRASRRRAI